MGLGELNREELSLKSATMGTIGDANHGRLWKYTNGIHYWEISQLESLKKCTVSAVVIPRENRKVKTTVLNGKERYSVCIEMSLYFTYSFPINRKALPYLTNRGMNAGN